MTSKCEGFHIYVHHYFIGTTGVSAFDDLDAISEKVEQFERKSKIRLWARDIFHFSELKKYEFVSYSLISQSHYVKLK